MWQSLKERKRNKLYVGSHPENVLIPILFSPPSAERTCRTSEKWRCTQTRRDERAQALPAQLSARCKDIADATSEPGPGTSENCGKRSPWTLRVKRHADKTIWSLTSLSHTTRPLGSLRINQPTLFSSDFEGERLAMAGTQRCQNRLRVRQIPLEESGALLGWRRISFQRGDYHRVLEYSRVL